MPTKFDFISPDVVFNEVDLSQLPTTPDDEGLLVIGRASRGPAMQPIRIRNSQDLDDIFGEPLDGTGPSATHDTFRDGNVSAPTYGLYAAKTWLENAASPVTYIRLAGEDASSQAAGYTKAGWTLGTPAIATNPANNIGAYGLFVCPTGSSTHLVSGSLAAIFYTSGACLTLDGKLANLDNGGSAVQSTSSLGAMIESDANGTYTEFKIDVHTAAGGSPSESIYFNLIPGDNNSVRNAVNTNPQRLVSGQYASTQDKKFFLGESFETSLQHSLLQGNSGAEAANQDVAAGKQLGILLPLVSGSAFWASHEQAATAAKSGWVINRRVSGNETEFFDPYGATKLFRVVALQEGVEFQNKHAIVISDLKIKTGPGNKSTFTLKVVNDTGGSIEEYTNLNLDSTDSNFIGRRIGTTYRSWDNTNKVFNMIGEYPNQSDYIRIELSDDLIAGLSDQSALPFGFYGDFRPRPFTIHSGSATKPQNYDTVGNTENNAFIGEPDQHYGFAKNLANDFSNQLVVVTGDENGSGVTASFDWGSIPLTDQSTNGGNHYAPTDLFGIRNTRTTDAAQAPASKDFFKWGDYKDFSKILGGAVNQHASASNNQITYVFSLDQIMHDAAGGGTYYHKSGSCAVAPDGGSYTALSGTADLLDQGIKQFVFPLYGGFDGLDITQADAFSQRNVLGTLTANQHYAVNSIEKAIDIAADKDQIDYDVIAYPGLMHTALSNKLINIVEKRADCLAILDLDDSYNEKYENSGTPDTTNGTVTQAISNIKSRDWDSSYAATYFPRVKMSVDGNNTLTVPASVAAIGAIAQAENDGSSSPAPWFAPAGFNRGGLGDLSPYPVINCHRTLTKGNRDDLYQLNVNPIARFAAIPAIVVFGQKTLQQTPSALDRVNVRRLMNYLKKRIGRIADTILFEPNLNATWNNFNAQAGAVLQDVQTRYGIAEYKLVLDETTTTADLVDRNIMYAKIFIKPARAIEFIAIDFIITRSGIEF